MELQAPPADAAPGNPTVSEGPVQGILAALRDAAGGARVTVADLRAAVASDAQPVFLLLPAVILVSPLSGIPGLSSLGGLTIALVALQMLLNCRTIWLPARLLRLSLPGPRVRGALARLDRPARFIDDRTTVRASWFVAFPGRQLALATCTICGLAMPFLELVPFSATVLASVVALLAAALVVRDGLMVALGLAGFGLLVTKIAVLVPG